MSQIGWILFTAACAVGLVIMVPFMMLEVSNEVRRDGMEP